MMKRFTLLTFLLVLMLSNGLFSQSRFENKKNFYEAESWILYEDYKEALQLYLGLNKIYPNNSNVKYRIGQCYINIPGEKEKAISYLEEAVNNINPQYKEDKFKETGAPYDSYYYLANAYRINNQLDKALETYKLFINNMNPAIYDSTIVNQQIQSCINAKDLMGKPLYIREKNLGTNINESNSEYNPAVTDNEELMVFTKAMPFYDAIMYSTKTNGIWNSPVNMNELLKVDYDFYPTSISKDGKELYMYSSQDYDGVIFYSKFENGSWSVPVKLNDNINTKYWESHATISHDNKKLYFTSNRKGTLGGLDIYVSSRDSSGNWGPAENLGPVINTPYNEETPFLSKDDKTLFFSSRGHFNMGGYDIFYSTLLDKGEWSVPLNFGYPLNSTDDDIYFKPLNDGYEGYFAKYDPDGFGKQDIYRIEIFSEDHPRKFLVMGMVKVADLEKTLHDGIKISALNLKNPNQTIVVYSDPKSGDFEFIAPQGDYEVTFESPVSEKVKKDLILPVTNPSDSFLMPGTILPIADYVADLYVKSNKNISVTKGDSILFPLKVEPGSVLTVEHWVGDSLVLSEQFSVSDSTFNYKVLPQYGDNKITFKLTDRHNNKATTDVFIAREKGITSQRVVRPEYRNIIKENATAKSETKIKPEELNKQAADTLLKTGQSTDISAGINKSLETPSKCMRLWYLWLLLGGGIILFFILFRRKQKKDKSS
jgi:tetratricopeptide (TPR) repeat protein